MLILIILLGVLGIGLVCFVAGQIWEHHNTKRLLQAPNPSSRRVRSRRRIERDLNQLHSLYEQGLLSEEKYLYLADQLIDQLAFLLDPEPASVH
ncbi:hypothetical protein [Spirosoma fluminis]